MERIVSLTQYHKLYSAEPPPFHHKSPQLPSFSNDSVNHDVEIILGLVKSAPSRSTTTNAFERSGKLKKLSTTKVR